MAIRIVLENPAVGPRYDCENCCFCYTPTPYWTHIRFRKPGEEVACCEACSKVQLVRNVPNKVDWCNEVERQMRTYGASALSVMPSFSGFLSSPRG